jgi:hypothetical protein
MCVERENDNLTPMDGFDRELSAAMRRRPAPMGLKRAVMERRRREHGERSQRMVWIERIAASLVLAAVAGGGLVWRNAEQHRRGEEAKRQVFTALRITNHALEMMNAQLQARDAK